MVSDTHKNQKNNLKVYLMPFRGLDCYSTRVWVSKKVAKTLNKYQEKKDNPKGALMKKLARWSKKGFEHWEGNQGMPIKLEWGGVWRLRHEKLRMIGFYENSHKADFIVLDVFEKQRQKLTQEQQKRINSVAEIKQGGQWEKHHERNKPTT